MRDARYEDDEQEQTRLQSFVYNTTAVSLVKNVAN